MRRLALGLGCLMLLSGCAMAGGVQVEGAASQVKPPPPSLTPPSGVAPSFDPVAVLRADPKVNEKIKSLLTPCAQGRFPVDARYVDVTGDDVAELVVAVTNCDVANIPLEKRSPYQDAATSRGVLANYVYDVLQKPPVDLLAIEDPGIMIDQGDGLIAVLHWEYRANDKTSPTGQSFTYYKWTGTMFEQFQR